MTSGSCSPLYGYLAASASDGGERLAVRCRREDLTYRELEEQSATLAGFLAARGIAAGSRVALWLPKGVESVVTVFAALRLNAPYVPIDITSPAARAARVVAAAGCEALFCRAADLQRLPRPLPPRLRLVVVLGQAGAAAAAGGDGPPAVAWRETATAGAAPPAPASPEEIAYILYTSGSTGEPKGVAISHRAAAAFVEWAGDLCELGGDDRVSNHAALSFDLSVFDLFATVRAGGLLLPVPSWPFGSGRPFARFIADQEIRVWYSVPTVLSRIAASQAERPVDLSSLRVVIFAGEPFPKAGLVDFQRHVPQARLFNFYGPTETNVCLFHPVESQDLEDATPLPIGLPCPYSELRVRDQEGGLGELLVAGSSLMSGYWRGDEVDAGVFVDDPGGGRRFYPTGDYVSRDARGRYHFHGRRDSQIKLHGHRIELGEIEEHLAREPGVGEAAVVCSRERLVAFVVPESTPPLSAELLRHRLAAQLPPHMVPAELHTLAVLPRTDRGKVDRRALKGQLEGAPAE